MKQWCVWHAALIGAVAIGTACSHSTATSGGVGGATTHTSSGGGLGGATTHTSSGGGLGGEPPDGGDGGTGGPLLGIYEQGSLPNTNAMQAWLGETIWLSSNPASSDDPGWLGPKGPGWPMWKDAAPGRRLVLQVDYPALPSDAGAPSLAACANHDYDTYWTTLAQNLVMFGLGDSHVRFLHEFNGWWYPWAAFSTSTGPAEYVGCFQSFVAAMRKAMGQQFTFVWNPALGGANDVTQAYPGDAYVDEIGVDFYDESYKVTSTPPTAADQQAVWQILLDPSAMYPTSKYHGLTYYVGLAKAHTKPLVIPEWGVTQNQKGGGGDDPQFIENVYNFIFDQSNGVAWHVYFNVLGGDGKDHELYPTTQFPASAEMYRKLFGNPDGGVDGG